MIGFATSRRIKLVSLSFLVATMTLGIMIRQYSRLRRDSAPSEANIFATGIPSGWTTLGGTWSVRDGIVENTSDERGAKLIGGSSSWRDFTYSADVELLGEGDAGLIARTSNEEQGVDAYDGYYLGLRTADNMVIMGRSDFAWLEFPTAKMPGGVQPYRWYHLVLSFSGCKVRGSSQALPDGPTVTLSHENANCHERGRVGLRSYSAGGRWRNVSISPLQFERTPLPAVSGSLGIAEKQPKASSPLSLQSPKADDSTAARTPFNVTTPIDHLRWLNSDNSPATVRGTVIATDPMLFVEDATGGLAVVSASTTTPLKVGDEVEATGSLVVSEDSVSMKDAAITALWPGNPLPPLAISASQAASGRYHGRYIEVDGTAISDWVDLQGSESLTLVSGPQQFRVLAPSSLQSIVHLQMKDGSKVRVRGVCRNDLAITKTGIPFAVTLTSAEDFTVVAGPPWWTVAHIIVALCMGGAAIAAIYALRLRGKHARLRAVMDERERIAHEMHDTLAQSIAGIGYQISAIRNNMPKDMPKMQKQLNVAAEMVRHIHDEARRNIATLRPESLQDVPLSAALASSAERMLNGGGVKILTTVDGEEQDLPLRVKDTLFRIGHEAIANCIRHASPTMVDVHLTYSRKAVCLRISDDGVGYRAEAASKGFGVVGMQKRAHSLSGAFTIGGLEGGGTRVEVSIPLHGSQLFHLAPVLRSHRGRGRDVS
jgi:signal transduction histidine kinase